MAARFRVIVLDKSDLSNQNVFRYVLWADVPAARQPFYVQPADTVSAWSGAQTGDNAQLVSGAVAEKVDTIQVAPGTGMPAIQAEIQIRWQTYQEQVTNLNPWNRYGSTWDGTTWVLGGVA
jgi:hypothetical protein